MRSASATAPVVAPRAAASSPAAGLALLSHISGWSSDSRFAARPTPPPEPPEAPMVAPFESSKNALHATAAVWVLKGYRVQAPSPALPRTGAPMKRNSASFHSSLLLTAYAAAEDLSSDLRFSEHPSAPVAHVYISRSEIGRRQELPVPLAGRRLLMKPPKPALVSRSYRGLPGYFQEYLCCDRLVCLFL